MASTTQNKSYEDMKRDVHSTAEKAKETASNIGEKAKETAANVADKAKQAAANVKDRADDAVSGAGSGMQNLAQQIRDKGPHEGMLGSAGSAVAGGLEQTGRYLEEHGVSGMAEDLTNTIRRNPIPAVLIAVGVGYLLAKLTTPRNSY